MKISETLLASRHTLAALTAACALLAAPTAFADKPPWAGGPGGPNSQGQQWRGDRQDGNSQGESRRERDDDRRSARRAHDARHNPRGAPVVVVQPGSYFNSGHRNAVVQYYQPQVRAGKCPPGLAKKNNGCMPPGQAKKWHVGQRLPAGVAYYPVPQPVLVQLGPAPVGYRYVRVADDILLLSTGTQMVIDAIQGIFGL